MSVTVRFLPDNIAVTAAPGEPLLNVAERAGVTIPTGCLSGACYACEVEIAGKEDPVRACISSVPIDKSELVIHLYEDPAW